MNVTTVGWTGGYDVNSPVLAIAASEEEASNQEITPPEESAADPVTPTADAETEEVENAEEDKAKGVLRLLQQGHFRGVADVRLRINFYDQIAALECERSIQAAESGISGMIASVGSQVESLIQEGNLDEQASAGVIEALDVFNAAVAHRTDDFVHGETTPDELTGGLQAGFDEFVASMETALGLPSESGIEEPGENTPPAAEVEELSFEPPSPVNKNEMPVEAESSIDLQVFIDNLIEIFASKLQELELSLVDVQVLPALSEPRGNGGAYQKFLTMYNDLRGASEGEPQQQIIDTVS